MKRTVIESLVRIGNPDAIPYIRACPDIDYRSPYKPKGDNYFSVANAKRVAIDYLEKQKASPTFIEPPELPWD